MSSISVSRYHMDGDMDLKTLKEIVDKYESFITDSDLNCYIKYIADVKGNEIIYDLGTGWGKSAIAFSKINGNARIITVDDGSYPIFSGFAKNKEQYVLKITKRFTENNSSNICYIPNDLIKTTKSVQNECASLIHADLMPWGEVDIVKSWFPKLKIGGILLLRNYERMRGEIYKNFLNGRVRSIDENGIIRVFERVR